jgi:hypothetical protein
MAVILSAYLAVLGTSDTLSQERIYKILKKDPKVVSEFDFVGGGELMADAVGCALKVAIGKELEPD